MTGATTEPIEIVVNGKPVRTRPGLTVEQFLGELGIEPSRVAVELNRTIVHQRNWRVTAVEAGAEVEIVQFVGGG